MPAAEIKKFWEQTRASLAEVDVNATVEQVEETDVFTMEGRIKTRTIYREIMSSFEGRRIRAWYTVPSGQPPARGWPAIMEVPGYGGTMPLPIHLVQYGYATLSLYPRSQGESLKEWEIEHGTRLVYKIADRDRYYYRGAYMDCVRGLDFLCDVRSVRSRYKSHRSLGLQPGRWVDLGHRCFGPKGDRRGGWSPLALQFPGGCGDHYIALC